MTITTRTVAKRVLPRQSKPKSRSQAKKGHSTKPMKGQKRVVADNNDEEDSEPSDSEHEVKKKPTKWQHVEESDIEVKEIESDAEPPEEEVEEVEAKDDVDGAADDEEVSATIDLYLSHTH